MRIKAVFLKLLLPVFLSGTPVFAYQIGSHKEFVAKAVENICAAAPSGRLCLEMKENIDFMLYGAAMEDDAYKGFKQTLKGMIFKDEEPERYGPCKAKGKYHPFCSHYFFVSDYLSDGAEGACARSVSGATNNILCSARISPLGWANVSSAGAARPKPVRGLPFRWESARQRGLRLWKEKVFAYYFSAGAESKARAYYWLGRVAHLLADTAVPGHVAAHTLNRYEFEHRIYEKAAESVPVVMDRARIQAPDQLSDLFVDLALKTIKTDGDMRTERCWKRPGDRACQKGWFGPTSTLESRLQLRTTLRIVSLILFENGTLWDKTEVKEEQEFAREEAQPLKARSAVYTEKFFELFGAQAGLSARDMNIPAPAAEPARSDGGFDGGLMMQLGLKND